MKYIIIPVFAFITLIIGACNKAPVNIEGTLLKQITDPLGRVDTFIYDSNNRLLNMRTTDNTGNYENIFEYDAPGKLIRIIERSQNVDLTNYSVLYNAAEQIVKKVGTPLQTNGLPSDHSYTYNSKGELITDTLYKFQTKIILYYNTYKYNIAGNIEEVGFYNPTSGYRDSAIYTYDNNPNPYHTLVYGYYHAISDKIYLSKNNPVAINSPGRQAITISYEYQQNGLPVQRIIRDPNYNLSALQNFTYQ